MEEFWDIEGEANGAIKSDLDLSAKKSIEPEDIARFMSREIPGKDMENAGNTEISPLPRVNSFKRPSAEQENEEKMKKYQEEMKSLLDQDEPMEAAGKSENTKKLE